jgi:putative ABC transport system permease protein
VIFAGIAGFAVLLHKKSSVPIAWLLLVRQPIRMITALVGIVFAATLILMQLGFRDALFQSSIALIQKLDTDLVMLHSKSVSSTSLISFDPSRLAMVEGISGVVDTVPVRWDYVRWRYQNAEQSRLAVAIGVSPSQQTFKDSLINSQQHKLINDDTILYDSLSRPEFGPVVKDFNNGVIPYAFVNSQRVQVVGLVSLGTSFGYDAAFITSDSTLANITDLSIDEMEVGLIRLSSNSDSLSVLQAARNILPDDVMVMTKADFAEFERSYWDTSKPVGYVFMFGVVMGFLVGLIIVYQILYSDVSSHIQEYATMLAMGFRRGDLMLIVLKESLLLTLLGYPIAYFFSLFLYSLVRESTSIKIYMTSERAATTFLILLIMAAISATFALQRLRDADPVDAFS